ncbi:hypothetical protein Droror1_Dr00022546 [Drosera rotundifolia]
MTAATAAVDGGGEGKGRRKGSIDAINSNDQIPISSDEYYDDDIDFPYRDPPLLVCYGPRAAVIERMGEDEYGEKLVRGRQLGMS